MKAWIFDVDGVLSNLETRQVSEPNLLPTLARILTQGDIIAFNTGRTVVWVEERVLTPLKKLLPDPSLIEHVFLSCEKGGTWKQEGHDQVIQEKFIAPSSFREKIHSLVTEEFSDAMFVDEAKQTMVSIEKRQDVSLAFFHARLAELKVLIERSLVDSEMTDAFHTAEDIIAIDIQHKEAGKDIGMQHILTWLDAINKHPDHFYCFGDNPSDLHMGDLLNEHAYDFTFVYVGTKPISPTSFLPIIPEEKFDKGTAEVLRKLL